MKLNLNIEARKLLLFACALFTAFQVSAFKAPTKDLEKLGRRACKAILKHNEQKLLNLLVTKTAIREVYQGFVEQDSTLKGVDIDSLYASVLQSFHSNTVALRKQLRGFNINRSTAKLKEIRVENYGENYDISMADLVMKIEDGGEQFILRFNNCLYLWKRWYLSEDIAEVRRAGLDNGMEYVTDEEALHDLALTFFQQFKREKDARKYLGYFLQVNQVGSLNKQITSFYPEYEGDTKLVYNWLIEEFKNSIDSTRQALEEAGLNWDDLHIREVSFTAQEEAWGIPFVNGYFILASNDNYFKIGLGRLMFVDQQWKFTDKLSYLSSSQER